MPEPAWRWQPNKMHIPRIYQDMPLKKGQNLYLSPDAVHHVTNVLRMKEGQELFLFNGEGGYFNASIVHINKRQTEVVLEEFYNNECESTLDMTLAVGISRGQRMDFTLQKSVELGVKKIVPLICKYGNAKPDGKRQDKRMQHWQKIIIGSCEQCGRNRIPDLCVPENFSDWVSRGNTALKIILHPGSQTTLGQLHFDQNDIVLLAGPEGGFSDDEIRIAGNNGYQLVSMGPRILRTETAPLAAITACQVLWGDLD